MVEFADNCFIYIEVLKVNAYNEEPNDMPKGGRGVK